MSTLWYVLGVLPINYKEIKQIQGVSHNYIKNYKTKRLGQSHTTQRTEQQMVHNQQEQKRLWANRGRRNHENAQTKPVKNT